ncbi:helix-turn-helix domain-containing protein [Halovivax sp.]|uniref:helix-turn-helix domain-containing protein n=1 Tax=Halovivax sp. TaxID=1935978 RepID=UPI0025BC9595|nr:helix-turn-helix domain-containing protein [Halovivax sp.]
MTGYHATIVVRDPGACPVAIAADRTGSSVESISRSSTRDSATVVEEFTVRDPDDELAGAGIDPTADGEDLGLATDGAGDVAVEAGTDAGLGVELTTVAETDTDRVYRFERDWSDSCVCEVVEERGNPVSSLRAEDGALHLSINASDLDGLSDTVTALQDRFDAVSLRELTRSERGGESDLVLVDRARLTDRQQEVLETAHRMGYFDYPKGANAGEVAAELDISGSTFAEHLAAAQSKLMAAIIED